MKHWLIKSEPETYSIDKFAKDGKTLWEGVRNYQARNLMRNEMAQGDLALFYHSNAEPSCVVGVAKVSGAAVPDPTQFQKKGLYYEPKATPEKPIWFCVEFQFVEKLKKAISLHEIKAQKGLEGMHLVKQGSRLSVQPVKPDEFKKILKMGGL